MFHCLSEKIQPNQLWNREQSERRGRAAFAMMDDKATVRRRQ